MIGLRKKQPFSLKNILTVDFALPLNGRPQPQELQKRLQALRGLGVQQVVFVSEPVSFTETDDKLVASVDANILSSTDGIIVETVPSYWLDEAFETFVKQQPLTAYRGKYVLLALRNFNSIRGLKGPLFEIRARGYEPIILHRDPKQYIRLKAAALEYLSNLGCVLQLDLLTLSGVYGAQSRSKSESLISNGWAGVLTTGIRTANDSVYLNELMLTTSYLSAFQQTIEQHLQHLALT